MAPATNTSTKPSASPSVREQAAELLAATKQIERDEENRRNNRAVASRLLLAVGGTSGRPYTNRRTKFSEGPEIPKSALVWVGETVHEELPGDAVMELDNLFGGVSTPFWRELTDDEAAVAVSDVMALRFLAEAENPAVGAESFLSDARQKNETLRADIEELKRRLSEKEAALTVGMQAEAAAEEFALSKACERDAWAKKIGRAVEALRAAVDLLRRPAPAVPYEPPSAKFDSGHFSVERAI